MASRFLSGIFAASLVLLNMVPANASTPEFSNCILAASPNQLVSLGSPMANERLAHKTNIRVGVLPFYFNNGQTKQLSDFEKKDYLDAASEIRRISNNIVSLQMVFLDSFKVDKSQDTLKKAYLERSNAWSQQNADQGTWGFVKKVISAADSSRDFSNLDSVILESNNLDTSYFISEAMGFYRGKEGNVFRFADTAFYKSIYTQDGVIDNAILFDSHKGPVTIVHELLHNFGLTDLYGSGSGPAGLSIMSAGTKNILNYEKAVLGWFPKENFHCKNLSDVFKSNSVDNVLELKDYRSDSILLLKKTEDTAYIFEIMNQDNESLLIVYLLEQEQRPPITVYPDPKLTYFTFYNLSNPKNIGMEYHADDFKILVTNIHENSVTLNLIPNTMSNSIEASTLIAKSLTNRDFALASAAAKADADAKAKADADAKAKAVADAKAKADADAKAKADAESKSKSVVKKTTITCTKGNTTKKITGLNPRCPLGFKIK